MKNLRILFLSTALMASLTSVAASKQYDVIVIDDGATKVENVTSIAEILNATAFVDIQIEATPVTPVFMADAPLEVKAPNVSLFDVAYRVRWQSSDILYINAFKPPTEKTYLKNCSIRQCSTEAVVTV